MRGSGCDVILGTVLAFAWVTEETLDTCVWDFMVACASVKTDRL
jgi:hypothetical protein